MFHQRCAYKLFKWFIRVDVYVIKNKLDFVLRYITGYCLAVLGWNQEPKAEDIICVLSSVGIESDGNKANETDQAIDDCEVNNLIATETVSQAKDIPSTHGYRISESRWMQMGPIHPHCLMLNYQFYFLFDDFICRSGV